MRALVVRPVTLLGLVFVMYVLGQSRVDRSDVMGEQAGAVATAQSASSVPAWHSGLAIRFPGCTPVMRLVPRVLVVDQDRRIREIPFARAFALPADANPANDVWVVGWCST